MTGLSDELNRLNVEGWSNRDIERIAERHGHRLHNSTVSNYMGGRHGKPTADKLAAFAAVFGVDVNDLRAAAGLPGLAEPFDLGPESARLTGSQREAVRHVVRVMLEQNDALARDAQQDVATTPPADAMRMPESARPAQGSRDEESERNLAQRPPADFDLDDFDLAAKRGRNRGREAREQQDRDAEGGGA